MRHEMRREPIANMLHKPLVRNETNKIQFVPFHPVTCLNTKLGMITNGVFQIHVYIVLCLCNHAMWWIRFIWVQRKQLVWCRPAVQAERPSWGGFGVGSRRLHMHSNSSMRCLVFPDRICRRVLYLSRPAFMFSAWIMSFAVFLLSSRATASSELKAWGGQSQRVVIVSGWDSFLLPECALRGFLPEPHRLLNVTFLCNSSISSVSLNP